MDPFHRCSNDVTDVLTDTGMPCNACPMNLEEGKSTANRKQLTHRGDTKVKTLKQDGRGYHVKLGKKTKPVIFKMTSSVADIEHHMTAIRGHRESNILSLPKCLLSKQLISQIGGVCKPMMHQIAKDDSHRKAEILKAYCLISKVEIPPSRC